MSLKYLRMWRCVFKNWYSCWSSIFDFLWKEFISEFYFNIWNIIIIPDVFMSPLLVNFLSLLWVVPNNPIRPVFLLHIFRSVRRIWNSTTWPTTFGSMPPPCPTTNPAVAKLSELIQYLSSGHGSKTLHPIIQLLSLAVLILTNVV